MFVEKLEFFGFKSFAQKTEMRFSPGLTGIVGPNGCGKSNVCDAFRWVLGEQNIRQIRGDSLQDVIFNGTRDVRPLGMAEVTITLNNQDGRLPIEFEHVAIRRRVFRSGESQFFINGTACRLKDIKTLFLDTGLGSFAYSVITRDMIDIVLSERDEARRNLFEEASGITRYKARRRETILKLDATERNLTRLQDILDVEEREMRSLARQVGKTRRYQRLRDRIRSLDLLRSHRLWEDLQHREAGMGDAHGEEARRRISLEAEISQKDARVETIQTMLLEKDREGEHLQSTLDEQQERVRTSSERILILRERGESLSGRIHSLGERMQGERRRREHAMERLGDLKPRQEIVEAEWKERDKEAKQAEEILNALDKQLKETKIELGRGQQKGLEGLEQEAQLRSMWMKTVERKEGFLKSIENIGRQRAALQERYDKIFSERELDAGKLGALKEEQEAAQENVEDADRQKQEQADLREKFSQRSAELQREWAAADSRLHLLEEQRRTFEGHLTGVRRLLEAAPDRFPGVRGALGDLVTVSPQWAGPVGLAMGEMVSWIVVDDLKTASAAMEWLREEGLGAVTFLPLDSLSSPSSELDSKDSLPIDALSASAEIRPIVTFLRTWICCVNSDEELPAPAQREAGRVWISATGRVHGASGWIRAAGAAVPGEDILRRGPAIIELQRQTEALEVERTALEERTEQLDRDVKALDVRYRELKDRLADLDRRVIVTERRVSEQDLELRILGAEKERLTNEEGELQEGVAATSHDLEGLAARREVLKRQEKNAEEELGHLSTLVRELEDKREAQQSRASEHRLETMRREGVLREVSSEVSRLEEECERLEASLTSMKTEEVECHREREEAHKELEELTRSIEILIRDRESQVKVLNDHRGERSRSQDELMGLEKEMRSLRSNLTQVQDTLREREVRLTQIQGEREQIRQSVLQEHQLDLGKPLPDPLPWSEEETALSEEAVDESLRGLRLRMNQLGPVNLLAITDYDEKKKHVLYLRDQRQDLDSARASLLEAIEKINTRARELFLETFGQVQEHFQGTFQSLFPGGEARLVLADDDPLEAEIDIQARPRGKKLESIRLLSTGERTLTATALLFALYLVKPSPFCILDEVDAPLDDPNTNRFIGMMRHFSHRTQFVLITHNKRTMEAGDVLYGVTMEELGISKIVSVRLREAQDFASDAPGPESSP
ncbi:MAG: chromosome segregation protein SMC, partial [Candidatus Eisenbacteria bacterium]|nr:chromosome segregation protein SMC [Candidatus Eisenbacteria bacterium]